MGSLRFFREASSTLEWIRLVGSLRSSDARSPLLVETLHRASGPVVVDLRQVQTADSLSSDLIARRVRERSGAVLLPRSDTPAGLVLRRSLGAAGLDRVGDLPEHLRPPPRTGHERRQVRRVPINEAVTLLSGDVRLEGVIVDRSSHGLRVDLPAPWPFEAAVGLGPVEVFPSRRSARVVRVFIGVRTTVALRFEGEPRAT